MFEKKLYDLYKKMYNLDLIRCIRMGLMMIIPILLIWSIVTVLTYIPIEGYQIFINEFDNGIVLKILNGICAVTGNTMAVYLTISLGLSYSNIRMAGEGHTFGVIFTSLTCFFIFTGMVNPATFDLELLGTSGMFTALVCGLSASFLYEKVSKHMKNVRHSFTEGADEAFQITLSTFIPMVIVIIIFAALNMLMVKGFHVDSILDFFRNITYVIFNSSERTLGKVFLYLFLLNLMWFFGIHGGAVFFHITENVFDEGIRMNLESIEQGLPPTDIYNGSFLSIFVSMGGCGTVFCLLIAILIFSKRRSNRKLARMAFVPCVFNISEFLVFGLPIAFNPIFFIPFLVTPMVMAVTSGFAMSMGWVPVPIHQVSWTMPVIIGGYFATESIAGAILQIVNICIGVLIYMPFVKMFDKVSIGTSEMKMDKLVKMLQTAEKDNQQINLLQNNSEVSSLSRILADDLEFAMKKNLPTMYYQPQFDVDGKCIGMEALLRWIHPIYGRIYPPLVIQLATESNCLLQMEEQIFTRVFNDFEDLNEMLEENSMISINVTGRTIQMDEFYNFLKELHRTHPGYSENITIEITEQAALHIDEKLLEKLTRIKDLGFSLAIDDFSMGNTSIKYLQTNIFSMIKLDGSISRNVIENERSVGIVSSITKLASELNIQVLAEFVETEEQRKILEDANCRLYQGALYGMAVPINDLKPLIKKIK